MRSDASALFRDRLFCNLNQYLLAFAQQIGDRRLMSLAARLATMTTLISLLSLTALVAWALVRFGCGRRRCDNLFLRFYKRHLLDLIILNLYFSAVVRLCSGTCRRFVFPGAASPAPAATCRKLAARLAFRNACIRIRVHSFRTIRLNVTAFFLGRLL